MSREILSFVIATAERRHVQRLQEIEVDAGEMFRAIGLGRIADDAPPSVDVLVECIEAGAAWVAVRDTGEVIGYAAASQIDDEAHLKQVSVVSSAAGHRVGAALVEGVCQWAREQGFSSITLTTFRDVPWNGPYYQRLGFSEVGETDCGPGLAQILFAERLGGIAVWPRIAMRRVLSPDSR